MEESTDMNFERRRRIVAEEIWLKYFNETLFEQGTITEPERKRMNNMINSRISRVGQDGPQQ